MNVVPCFEAKKKPSPTIITGDKLTEQEGVYASVGRTGEILSESRFLVLRHSNPDAAGPVVLFVDDISRAIVPAINSWLRPSETFIRLADAVVHFSIVE